MDIKNKIYSEEETGKIKEDFKNMHLNVKCSFEPYIKPPLGIRPRWACLEERITEIQNAINRYIEARKPIPKEWVEDLSESIIKLNSEYTDKR